MANSRDTRPASHAGSWYLGNAARLSTQLDEFLSRVPNKLDGKDLPISGARVIIAPSGSPLSVMHQSFGPLSTKANWLSTGTLATRTPGHVLHGPTKSSTSQT